MYSLPIQEFKSLPFRGTITPTIGSYLVWESPRLTTMFPLEGRPKGSDRGVCHTVNGFLTANFKDKTILDPTNSDAVLNLRLYAGLYGEYAGVSGLIQSTELRLSDIGNIVAYQSNGSIGFDAWSSFSNLAQNIYIRFTIIRVSAVNGGIDQPVDVTFTGALLASDLRF